MQDAWRAYLEMALGLTEAPRKKAQQVAGDVVSRGGATAAQLQGLAEDLLSTGMANREALNTIVRYEVDRALGAVGLATAEEVAELTERVRDLERQLRDAQARVVAAEAAASAVGAAPGGGPALATPDPQAESVRHAARSDKPAPAPAKAAKKAPGRRVQGVTPPNAMPAAATDVVGTRKTGGRATPSSTGTRPGKAARPAGPTDPAMAAGPGEAVGPAGTPGQHDQAAAGQVAPHQAAPDQAGDDGAAPDGAGPATAAPAKSTGRSKAAPGKAAKAAPGKADKVAPGKAAKAAKAPGKAVAVNPVKTVATTPAAEVAAAQEPGGKAARKTTPRKTAAARKPPAGRDAAGRADGTTPEAQP